MLYTWVHVRVDARGQLQVSLSLSLSVLFFETGSFIGLELTK